MKRFFWIQFKPIKKNNPWIDYIILLVAYLNLTMEMFVIDDQAMAIRSIGRFNLFPRVLAPRNCAFIASIWWLSVRIIVMLSNY